MKQYAHLFPSACLGLCAVAAAFKPGGLTASAVFIVGAVLEISLVQIRSKLWGGID